MRKKPVSADPIACARAAKLAYTTDTEPGITRKVIRKTFQYFDTTGQRIKQKTTLERIKQLAMPPAYTDVWICPDAGGHLQATGRDARGRKQYRYHAQWQLIRDETKYYRMLEFGNILPTIRQRVSADLELTGLPKHKVLAAVVKLLESTLIRVGNAEYARDNNSYGLTTLRKKHVAVRGNAIALDFKGKSAQNWSVDVFDKKIAQVIKKCEAIPGYQLFKYRDETGAIVQVNSQDVNTYLHEISNLEITAKDFRTWAGTVSATLILQEFAAFDSMTQAKKNVMQAVTQVAKKLGNTPAICRKCYIHPEVINTYLKGDLLQQIKVELNAALTPEPHALNAAETAVLTFLKQQTS